MYAFLLGDEVMAHRPNPQPGGPMYLSMSGCSPLTCPARMALPVATLLPAYLSRSLHNASLLTRQKMPSSWWRYLKDVSDKVGKLFEIDIQGVTGGTDQTSGGCSLCWTIPT